MDDKLRMDRDKEARERLIMSEKTKINDWKIVQESMRNQKWRGVERQKKGMWSWVSFGSREESL